MNDRTYGVLTTTCLSVGLGAALATEFAPNLNRAGAVVAAVSGVVAMGAYFLRHSRIGKREPVKQQSKQPAAAAADNTSADQEAAEQVILAAPLPTSEPEIITPQTYMAAEVSAVRLAIAGELFADSAVGYKGEYLRRLRSHYAQRFLMVSHRPTSARQARFLADHFNAGKLVIDYYGRKPARSKNLPSIGIKEEPQETHELIIGNVGIIVRPDGVVSYVQSQPNIQSKSERDGLREQQLRRDAEVFHFPKSPVAQAN